MAEGDVEEEKERKDRLVKGSIREILAGQKGERKREKKTGKNRLN